MTTAAEHTLRFLPADAAGPPTWGEACEEFYEDLGLRRISPRTVTWYRSVLGPFGKPDNHDQHWNGKILV